MILYSPITIDSKAKYILTDSRNLLTPAESIFFAIKGANHNGHVFVKDLYLKGVREFVIEQTSATTYFLESISFFENVSIWVVPSSMAALQSFVAKHRSQFNIDVIGITGSNGKTIVKEWLAQLLSNHYKIVKSPKSYNSQLGVPLSVWQMNESHTLGIFEAGISKPGEMIHIEKVIWPTIGVLTNIGTAHDEFFNNKNQKIKEKLELFANAQELIFCRDDNEVFSEIKKFKDEHNTQLNLISWSLADEMPNSFKFLEGHPAKLLFFNGKTSVEIPITLADEASIQNICTCVMVLHYLKIDFEIIKSKLLNLKPVSMRLELKEGIQNTHIIDDTYNNDFIGLKLALEFLNLQKQHKSKVVILSDILQSGENESNLYEDVAKLLEINQIDLLVGIGAKISKNANFFKLRSRFYQNTDQFLEDLPNLKLENCTILAKGARLYQFEKIVRRLQAKNHETFLEINLDSVIHNLNYYKSKINAKTRIMAMVKAFAYGAGNKEIALLLQHQGVGYLGVAYCDEGVYLRENGLNLPIMVMNPTESDFQKILDFGLEPEIYSLKKLKKFADFMESQSGLAKIHIKIDTGMHRLGFQESEIDSLIAIIKQNPNIIVATIFSHMVATENPELDDFSNRQAALFRVCFQKIAEQIGYTPLTHILNSAGIGRFPNYHFDMVRLGLGLYGMGSNAVETEALQVVGTLKSSISQIKELDSGETVGYGRKGIINNKSTIATIAIGYADGYCRRFGNGVGKINVKGVLCPTIGNICMDMTMIDITGVEAQEGDEVIVFGENPTATQLAEQIGTISYEILTNIGERVKRVFYKI